MADIARKLMPWLACAVLLVGDGGARAEMTHSHEHRGAAKASCDGPELDCATKASAAFAPDGTLWLVWAAGGRVSVAKSGDLAKSFVPVVTLPTTALPLDDGPDARPRIAVGRDGKLIVTFATRDDKYNGHGFVARSDDGGKSFSAPAPITTNSPSQRFETAIIDSDGRAFFAWIDKRDAAAAKAANKPYAGAALAYAWEDGAARSLPDAKLAQDNTCECCRIAASFAGPGKPAILFRNIFDGGIRDHAVITFANRSTPEALHRVSDDDAVLDACPHQGPSLSIGPDGIYHATWLALGTKRKGLYYARSLDGGATFSSPLPLGDSARQNSRPYVLAAPDRVVLAYKAFDGERTTIEVMTSRDSGATWSAPREAAATTDDSDHPQLLADGNRVYLSWLTRKDGYRLIPFEDKP
jgi:hypothetical protein